MQSVTRHVNNTSLQLFIFCLTWATKKIECQELREKEDSLVFFFFGLFLSNSSSVLQQNWSLFNFVTCGTLLCPSTTQNI
jgi:hypothetical protein